ncbi:hypothetical protein FS749_013601 [Ceratobasidium sp. UAMH 11750]|nr:hypothetical protein FS749_013601 [Ceratobasidium sp. UAMH 11750]
MVDDIECRLNVLFDALNCETLSRAVVDQLIRRFKLCKRMMVLAQPPFMSIFLRVDRARVVSGCGCWV